MIGASMAVRPPRSRGPVLMMIDALRRIGGSLWMVENAFSGAFVDNAGTQPVTAVGDLIGKVLDKTGTNHATQSAVASKPSVQRVPKRTRGATNLLLWSGDFSNAAWTKAGATVATGQADPLGGTSASKLVESATNSAHYFLQSVVSGTGTATSAWIVKPAGRSKIQVCAESPQTGMLATMFNLTTGAIQKGTGSIVALDNGFFLCAATAPSAGTGANGYHLMQTLNDSWQETYTGDGTSGVIVYRAGLFAGTVTAQQIIDGGGIPLTTTTALPNVLEWANVISFDGSNDFLQTGITTGNEGWVCAGVTSNSYAVTKTIFWAGANAPSEIGATLRVLGGGSVQMVTCDGIAQAASSAGANAATGTPQVIEGGWNATTLRAAVDGAEATAPNTRGGASTQTAKIGDAASGQWFNGLMHAFAYTPILPSAADRATIRNGIAALQGRTL